MKIKQMANNQYILTVNNIEVFYSYESVIAVYTKSTDTLILGKDWNFSRTTCKYLKQFFVKICPCLLEKIMLLKGCSFPAKIKTAFERGFILYQDELLKDVSLIAGKKKW